jgi:alkylhydroperoxidase family enzyme
MFLQDVQQNGELILGVAVPQILHLFSYRPEWTAHLSAFTQSVMRGPSELAPAQRELIAAFTSSVNSCHF